RPFADLVEAARQYRLTRAGELERR
ncbi:MAG: hypothetical protein QOF68_503, partial [Gaiellales bacterium]|nr:hypothetical protein [Gaiellales bacterium]